MIKIATADSYAEEKVVNGLTREARVIMGNGADNAKSGAPRTHKIGYVANGQVVEVDAIPFKVTSRKWKNSEGQFNLYREMNAARERIQNGALAPSATDLAAYYAMLFIDVQRQADELADHSAAIFNVVSRPDAQEVTYLRDLIPYTGKEKIITGAGDSVPLLEENQAQSAAVTLYFKAFGRKDSIRNLVFNPFDQVQRVTEAAAKINVDSRNNDVIGPIVAATYGALHAQAADATSGATYDVLMYNTLRKGLKTLSKLTHPLTNQTMAALGGFSSKVKILCHPGDTWSIQRIASGQLAGAGGLLQVATALPFAEIIPYGGGIMNGLTWGKETLSLPGVTQGTCFMFLPNDLGGFVLDKIGQTMEMGSGSVLELSKEERAWYRVNGLFPTWFQGGSATNTGKGCVIKVTLPAET
jgi:hypothetical protein